MYSFPILKGNETFPGIKTTFVGWNKATLTSLRTNIRLSKDIAEKRIYQNRLLAFKAYLSIKADNGVNSKSVRYQFVEKLKSDKLYEKDFLVIEANRSGEVIELRSFVVTPSGKIPVPVMQAYVYVKGCWRRDATPRRINADLKLDLTASKLGSGINPGDVIVTEFENYSIKTSNYFIYWTLPVNTGLKNTLLND